MWWKGNGAVKEGAGMSVQEAAVQVCRYVRGWKCMVRQRGRPGRAAAVFSRAAAGAAARPG